MWKVQPEGFLKEAFIDMDGTSAGTDGECKQGIGLSYKGIWGYALLIVSLANTDEVLYLCNRPANFASHSGSVEWIDRAVELVGQVASTVTIRGDTDFTHTAQLDRWAAQGRFSSWAWTRIPRWRNWPKRCRPVPGSHWNGYPNTKF